MCMLRESCSQTGLALSKVTSAFECSRVLDSLGFANPEPCPCTAAHGMPSDLALQTERTGLDAAGACKVVHALIRQRQRDVARQRDSQDRMARSAPGYISPRTPKQAWHVSRWAGCGGLQQGMG